MTVGPISVVLTGGGTGGHVIPAIAVAEEIVRLGGRARFIGLSDRIEARLVPQAGFGIDFVNVRPLHGGGIGRVALGLGSIPTAVVHAALLLRKTKPNVVLGVGGYVAGPVMLAAGMQGIPTALLEQNATVGLTNVLLSWIVDKAFVSYEETMSAFPEDKVELTGNPVRQSIVNAAKKRREKQVGPVRIVVMGGSQGALAIDDRVPQAMARAGLTGEVTVLHQCGDNREEKVRSFYGDAQIEAEVVPFIEDMAAALKDADMVVARAGATTISELTAVGLPAVLLPYPHHEDHQQELNAEPMRRAGAALVLNEKFTDIQEMADAIANFVRDKTKRRKAAKCSALLGQLDAASRVVDGLHKLSKGKP
ncbi:MAG: undecaprenyldiphospho-muramoylpentapeptide beta-N-acetylglucosaminyltransferase [Proteobacteria bacterium]|nr:undecaprenyldiphospho-muramoylpentapeptide beta-N-acetylglucosaminyltransferase [Pseudomonadota bacterium]